MRAFQVSIWAEQINIWVVFMIFMGTMIKD